MESIKLSMVRFKVQRVQRVRLAFSELVQRGRLTGPSAPRVMAAYRRRVV